ncbi:hypothetical protein LZ30DRAFT_739586 [Colletotrichum cereale]|nr:hypothetical protein LZ30DRAFT_739586 [Colletotrichum cereale]
MLSRGHCHSAHQSHVFIVRRQESFDYGEPRFIANRAYGRSSLPYYLRSWDVLPLRETCRAAAAGTFRLFRGHLFTSRFVMLERQSMQNLIEISRHPVLREAVKVSKRSSSASITSLNLKRTRGYHQPVITTQRRPIRKARKI